MNTNNTIRMPKRFDYSFNNEFNMAVGQLLNVTNVSQLILDCSDMEYIDSVGVGLIVMAHKKAQLANVTLEIVNLMPVAREILRLTNIQKIIDLN